MPRQPRYNLPGLPQHVIQRGNNRQDVFFDDGDYIIFKRFGRHCRGHRLSDTCIRINDKSCAFAGNAYRIEWYQQTHAGAGQAICCLY